MPGSTETDIPPKSTTLRPYRQYAAVFLLTCFLYLATAARGPLWQDSGMYLYRIWNGDILGGLGLACAHPLFHVLGILFKQVPIGEYGFRITAIASLAGAFTVANVFLFVRIWTQRLLPAVIAAGTLAFSWTFWQHACMAETYTLYTAIFSAELIFLLLYIRTNRVGCLLGTAFLNGLSISNHMFGSIALGCYLLLTVLLIAKKRIAWKQVGLLMLCWAVGTSFYLILIIKYWISTGDLFATIQSALFGNSWQGDVLQTRMTGRLLLENVLFVGYSFPTPLALLAIPGVIVVSRKSRKDMRFGIFLLALFLYLIFAFRYTVPDRYAFFIPFYVLAAVFIGLGASEFLKPPAPHWLKALCIVLIPLPVAFYGIVPRVAEKQGFNLGTGRSIPYRNEYTYFLQPWQANDNGPRRFAEESFETVEPDSVILADGTTVYPLWYVQTLDKVRPDVAIVSGHGSYQSPIPYPDEDTIEKLISTRPVYVVSAAKGYCPEYVSGRYELRQAGPLYRVVRP